VVGLVLVSHSHRLAEGAAELARQMAGEDVRIETAGGLDTPGHEIGTDAVLVRQAIERAWSPEGVLVLMDLGSAVLSAEMAVDLLAEDVDRTKVRLIEAPFVEGAVAAAVTARVGAGLDEVAAEARGGLAGKTAHLASDAASTAEPDGIGEAELGAGPPAGRPGLPLAEAELTVTTAHGLHARPAAAFVRTASSFDADVRVAHLSRPDAAVSARSLNAVATLGVRHGDRILVRASGPQGREAVDALRSLAARNFDESLEPEPPAPTTGIADASTTALIGIAASPGPAVGPVVRFVPATLEVYDRPPRSAADERRALDLAIEAVRADVEVQRDAMRRRSGDDAAGIFDAHVLLLEDEALVGRARAAADAGVAAEAAWRDAVDAVAAAWSALDDEYLRARAADVRSIGVQVLARLLGVPVPAPRLPHAGVLVAEDLTPADTSGLDPSLALAIATEAGGPTSHAAVIARSLAIPAVVALGPRVLDLAEGTTIAVDGDTGVVEPDPPAERVAEIEARRHERATAERGAREEARQPATTLDGTTIEVAANVGSVEEVARAVEAGCDGVGLFRTELLFLDRAELPAEDEQAQAYRAAAEALDGRPMILRTLDVGADKPLPSIERPDEANPFLGVRGVRLGLQRPELLATQLRAVLRAASGHPIRVMFPMVATVDELRAGRDAVDRATADLRRRGTAVPERIDVGVMVEVPSAALLAPALAEHADFFSIGTNDLTQYTLAAERGNAGVAALADALHPAVLALIERTCTAALAAGRWTGVCGELAGDPSATPLLLGLGVRELSMAPPAIGFVKRAVRTTDLGRARGLAERALACATAAEVRDLLAQA
jgi:phosphocarrier protein FPr